MNPNPSTPLPRFSIDRRHVEAGVSRLDAVRIADGHLYLFCDPVSQTWYVVHVGAVDAAGRMEPWDYAAWCYSAWCVHRDVNEATRAQLVEAGIPIPPKV